MVLRPLFFLLSTSLAIAPGCTCNKTEVAAEDAALPAVEAPAPAPDGLLADLFVPTPNATWQRLQRGVGGTLGILPSSLGGIACAFAGLDPNLAQEIDGTAPLTGALADDPKDVAWAVALKISEPRRAKDVLFESETSRYVSRPVAGMTLIVPKSGGSTSSVAALANGGYLVLARSEADLTRLGPYVYRTVPTKASPANGAIILDAPPAALKGPVRARIAALWDGARSELAKKDDAARAAHGGRAPDYADPRAVLSVLDGMVQGRLALLGDLDRMRLVVDVLETSVRADLVATPGEGEGPSRTAVASMRPGDAAPLLEGADSPHALFFRDDEKGRTETASDIEDAVKKALGERLGAPEAKRLHSAVLGWTRARGDWATLGLVGQDGLFLRAPAANAEAADHALRDLLAVVSAAPLKRGLRIQDMTVGAGTAQLAYGDAPAKGASPKKASVAWTAKGGEIAVTLSTPGSAAGAQPTTKKLGDEPSILAAVQALDKTVTFAAVAQPLKLDPVRALLPAAPVILAWGKRDSAAYFRIETSDGLVRELLKMRMGL